MAELTFKANFIFSNEGLPDLIKECLIFQYNVMRNELVEQTNPMLEVWNNEWNKDALGENEKLYNKFISQKFEPYLKAVNDKRSGSAIKLEMDEDCDIIGRCIYDGSTIHVTLVPM